MTALLLSALAAGFVGSVHCMGMCGAFAAACATRGGPLGTVQYSLGRLLAYGLLGVLAGSLGSVLGKLSLAGIVLSAFLLLYFSLRLAGLGRFAAGLNLKVPGLSKALRFASKARFPGARVLFGFANGFIPCGLVYAALALPIAAASVWEGGLVMMAFGLGTVPALSAVGLFSKRLSSISLGLRRIVAFSVLIIGVFAISMRIPPPTAEASATSEERLDGAAESAAETAADALPQAPCH